MPRRGRPPHLWLADGRSLYDTFGFEWTLLRIGSNCPLAERLINAAAAAGMQLQVVAIDCDRLRALYEAPLVLIRPDQIVAWRGQSGVDAEFVVRTPARPASWPRERDCTCAAVSR